MITIRVAIPTDADAMAEMQRRSILKLGASTYPAATVRAWAASVDPLKYLGALAAGEVLIVACDGADIVGYGRLVLGENRVRGLYVHPDQARSGVGTLLLEHLEKLAREHGIDRLHLSSSLNAVPFYRHHGYLEGVAFEVELRCHTPIECVVMAKQL